MCEENTSQKERFLQEVEQKLLRKELDARLNCFVLRVFLSAYCE